MSGRAGGSPQNEAVPLDNNVTNVLQSAVGVGPPGSSLSTLGVDSHLVRQLMTPVKNSGDGTGEQLIRLSGGDPRTLHSYTPHSSPSTPNMGEITPALTPCSSPRRVASTLLLEPPAKRVKVEEKPTDRLELRRVILDWKKAKLSNVKETYNNTLIEMFFLENHGNLMDLSSWSRRPSKEFLQYISVHKLEGDSSLEARFSHPTAGSGNAVQQIQIKSEVGGLPLSPSKSSLAVIKTSSSPLKPSKGMVTPVTGAPGGRQKTPSISESTSTTPNSQQDQMMEKARQEAYVVQRITSLRKDGLWGEKRLPKVQEPPRTKVHWDYLLEEMVWLSADFASERKWKKAAARKCARMVQKYFNDKAVSEQKAQKEQDLRIRKVAAFCAKEIRTFWGNVEKLVEYKVTTKLDEKKKKALDQQLSFIVDQTEKYSAALAESMNKPNDSANVSITSGTPSRDGLASDEEFRPEESSDDDEATIAREEDNPEEQADEVKLLQKESEQTLEDFLKDLPPGYLDTIGQAIDEDASKNSVSDADAYSETSEQKTQCDSDLSTSRKGRQDSIGSSNLDDNDSNIKDNDSEKESTSERRLGRERRRKVRLKPSAVNIEGQDKETGDEDFKGDETDADEEDTIQEQEEKEGAIDYKQELDELEADNDLPIEELRRRIAEMAEKAEPMEEDDSDEESEDEDGTDDEDEDVETVELEASKNDSQIEEVEEDETMSVDEDDEGNDEEEEDDDDDDDDEDDDTASDEGEEDCFGLETLVRENLQTESSSPKKSSETANQELEDAATVAEALQPKGFTLSSTKVSTPVPFLLKHTLREYQHVGLDWLYTMFEKKLNGILADEMGLGKTIQTISVLAHLACEKGNWGPHLIVVPTSVMLNWEMEFKKWAPAFKILTYYGTQKERKMKRTGWTKPNAFHVCITSYKLVIQDHQSFRRKKWKYFILDEAQNIKNFKSQRWQLLLNFQSQRRLLLTGTPLQNNLMELWSLMHFLMPNVFASHREFKEWFSNPVTGMIEGNKEYNESIIKRLHKVLRPFILRRLKSEVEKQMPKKYEHVVMCRLSKRQRFLYEEFMARSKTRETLESGNFLSVINVLMQLRKVCNHPNLFESRPIISPFNMDSITYTAPSLVWNVKEYDPFKHIDLFSLNLLLADLEVCLTAFAAHRIRKFQAPKRLIEEIDSAPEIPPKCPAGKIKLHVRPSNPAVPRANLNSSLNTPRAAVATSGQRVAAVGAQIPTGVVAGGATPTMTALSSGAIRFHLVQQGGALRAIPVASGGGNMVLQQTAAGPRLIMPGQRAAVAAQGVVGGVATAASPGITTGGITTGSPQLGGLQLVQTSTGQLLLTSAPVKPQTNTTTQLGVSGTAATALLQRLQGLRALQGSMITTGPGGRPVLRLPTTALRPPTPQQQQPQLGPQPVAASTPTVIRSASPASSPLNTPIASPVRPGSSLPSPRLPTPNTSPAKVITRTEQREAEKIEEKKKEDERKRSLFFLSDLDERRRKRRKEKLDLMARLNTRRCHACPIYGSDLIEAVNVVGSLNGLSNRHGSWKGQGLIQCLYAISENPCQYWEQTTALHSLVKTPEGHLKDLKGLTDRFVFCVPPVLAPSIQMRIFHPPPTKLWAEQRREMVTRHLLDRPMAPLHHIINAAITQFPDPRLIQYDCGKLQTLDKLLHQLKAGNHRALIFTQMTKMLDIFESFLNFHGLIYLRLDGSTKVEQRQVLMERFNQDKRIFAMILSTRSGGVGVNLTGADTVIFYDSDWNPTMDAQAQDRCHRIGQTRDVHIYRLISEKTIEENILKKANQKRLMADLAIEGGNFTTAHFKKQTINDLFEVNDKEDDATKRMSEVLEKQGDSDEGEDKQRVKMGAALESALAAAEDESDVQAAKTAKAEAAAELAEFDETIPIDETDTAGIEMSKAEQEVALLMKQLTPVEKYAMTFLESADDGWAKEAERMSAEIDQQKKDWELGRLQALREEEERLQQNSDEELLTYSSLDAHNQVNNKAKKKSTSTSRNIRSKRKVDTRKTVTRNKKRKGGRCKQLNEEECSNENSVDNSVDNSVEHSNQTSSKDGSGDEAGEGDRDVDMEDEVTDSSDSDTDYSSDGALERALEKRLGNSPEKINSSSMSEESPRTRSRGDVKINLWTLDKNPVLPGEKPMPVSRKQISNYLFEQGIDIPTDGEIKGMEDGDSRSGSDLSRNIGDEESVKNNEAGVTVGALKQGIVEGSSLRNLSEESLVAVNGDVEVEGVTGEESQVLITESDESREVEGFGSMEVSNYIKTTLPTPLNNGANGPTRITIENGTQ